MPNDTFYPWVENVQEIPFPARPFFEVANSIMGVVYDLDSCEHWLVTSKSGDSELASIGFKLAIDFSSLGWQIEREFREKCDESK